MDSELVDVLIHAFVFKAIGGLGIFLLGMKFMSEGMQAVAGNRLRSLISAVTNNRVVACLVGTAVTCLIQSSSVTTVMVVGFVNGGFMTLLQAIGVIIGANIGTTITGWILVLKIGKWGLPILGISAFAYLFAKRERLRFTAMAIMGIGMVFFGLQTMSSGFKDPAVKTVLESIFSTMSGGSILGIAKCAMVGCIATMIVQSSSATLGVTIALGQSGVLDFQTAAALIVGLNIGTTITAFLASLGASTNAKRAAYAHILFNVFGTVWLLPIFPYYVRGVEGFVIWFTQYWQQWVGHEISAEQILTAKIALTHTGFNVVNTILFLPLTGLLAATVKKLVREKRREIPHLSYLDVRMLETPAIAIQQSHDEIVRMGEHVNKMSNLIADLLAQERLEEKMVQKVFHREEVLDVVQKEMTEFLSHILSGNVSQDVIRACRLQLRAADEYESISDYYADVLKLTIKQRKAGLSFSQEAEQRLMELHVRVAAYVSLINEGAKESRPEVLSKARTLGDEITHLVKEARDQYLRRAGEEAVSPLATLIYTDLLNAYRRVKDHAFNIAEAVAGAK